MFSFIIILTIHHHIILVRILFIGCKLGNTQSLSLELCINIQGMNMFYNGSFVTVIHTASCHQNVWFFFCFFFHVIDKILLYNDGTECTVAKMALQGPES